ncbi:MAG: hypothetical protein ACKVX9_17055 [Blastocatellia bacterium]
MKRKNASMVSDALTYRCPKCKQVWLLIEATENAVHQCVVCDRTFVINQANRLCEPRTTSQNEARK